MDSPPPFLPPPEPIVVSLGNRYGALLFGSTACAVLFGVNSIQVFYYFRKFKRDKRALRILVASIWMLNAAQFGCMLHTVYFYTVKNFGNIIALFHSTSSLLITIILTAVNYMLVTFVYSLRIYIISDKRWYITIVPLILGTIGPVLGIALAARGFVNPSFIYLKKYNWLLYGSFSFAVACDLTVVTALCYYLHRGRSGLKESTTLVNTLILYCITTGAVSSLAHLANLILYVTMPNSFVYIGVFAFTPELYSNALLATLNARDHLRNRSVSGRSSSQIRFGETFSQLSREDSIQISSATHTNTNSPTDSVAFSTVEPSYWTIEDGNPKETHIMRHHHEALRLPYS